MSKIEKFLLAKIGTLWFLRVYHDKTVAELKQHGYVLY